MSNPDLDELAELAATGDRGAASRLLEQLRPGILRYCRARIGRTMGTYDDADDAAQAACLGVFTALPGYHDKPRPMFALAYRIAANKVADHYRGTRADRSVLMAEVPEPRDLGGDADVGLGTELSEQVRLLLGVLTARQRDTLILRVIVGMSADETAQAMDSTPGAVRVEQHRALNKLRSTLTAPEQPRHSPVADE